MLEGKVAIVTGASRGLGNRYTYSFMAREGAAVIVNYNGSAARAEEVVQEIRNAGDRRRPSSATSPIMRRHRS